MSEKQTKTTILSIKTLTAKNIGYNGNTFGLRDEADYISRWIINNIVNVNQIV